MKDYNPNKKNTIYCEWCNYNHNSRECPYEKLCNKEIIVKVGQIMEEFIEYNFKCTKCNEYSLRRLGDNSPSIDLMCRTCDKKIEIKSKCLSIEELPNEIVCKGGNYNYFKNNIVNLNLDLIVIIYGVNRKNKVINIREIYWFDNIQLKNQYNVKISLDKNLITSNIYIKNRNLINKIYLAKNITISFEKLIKKLINKINETLTL